MLYSPHLLLTIVRSAGITTSSSSMNALGAKDIALGEDLALYG